MSVLALLVSMLINSKYNKQKFLSYEKQQTGESIFQQQLGP